MKPIYTILIADRNSNVREFLKRELLEEGFRVRLAETGIEVMKMIFHPEPLDLVIIDPDLPDTEESILLMRLGDRIPAIPVIIHAFNSEETDYGRFLKRAAFVEKGGGSVEDLKRVVLEVLEGRKFIRPVETTNAALANPEVKRS